MARCHCPLICSPQPIARVLRQLPKLAAIFLIVHVIVMIYSFWNQPPPVRRNKPQGVLTENVRLAVDSSKKSNNSFSINHEMKMVRESRIDAAKLNKTKAKLKSVGQKFPKEVVKLKA